MIDVIGFNKEKNFFINKFKANKLHHSFILYGQKGIGKKFFIFNLIKQFIKLSISKNNIEHHFNLIDNFTHPNIKYIRRELDSKSNKLKSYITIDQIRKLSNFLYESSSLNNFIKILIIDSADELNISASNCLLKILEEPKKNTYIFLISHKISSLLPTIRSRCSKIYFNNHKYDSFKKIIMNNNIDINKNHIKFLYDISNGSPGIALYFNDNEIVEIFKESIILLSNGSKVNIDSINLSSKIAKFEDDNIKIYLSLLKFILLNLSKLKLGINIFNYYISDEIKNLIDVSDNISQETIINKLEYLIKNENDLFTYNLDKKIFILNFFTEV